MNDQVKGKRLSANAVDAKVDALAVSVQANNEALASLAVQMTTFMDAINRPVAIRRDTDAAALHGTQSDVAEFNDSGVLEKPFTTEVENPAFKKHADDLAFMAEPVMIMIHETSERDAENIFMVSVNGDQHRLERGKQYTLPRAHVAVLAAARPVHYENQEYVDTDGTRKVRWPSRRGLRYPFSVVQDSDRGRAWLRTVLAA